MAIIVPVVGDPIDVSHGISVANELNDIGTLQVKQLAADVSKTGTSFSDITGLSFAVVSGREYAWEAYLFYEAANVNTGLSVSHNHGGGDSKQLILIYGAAAGNTSTTSYNSGTDTNTGTSTVASSGAIYMVVVTGYYFCTSTGTFAMRYQRNGTSATVTIKKGSVLRAHSVA